MDAKFTDKKEAIFDIALEMFAFNGFENVTLQAIAKQAGMKTPSLYYYFPSKDDILDCIFQYFTEHFFDNVTNTKEIKELIEKGSYIDIINMASWKFNGNPKSQKRMTLILKIIYMRIMTRDEKAKKIFMDVIIDGNWKWAKPCLEYAVSVGKLSSDLDIKAFFYTLQYTQLMIGIVGLVDDYTEGAVKQQPCLNEFFAQLLEGFHKNIDKN